MDENYDWTSFYETLCQYGPDLLLGIDEDLRTVLSEYGSTTDMFWSDGLQDSLAEGAMNGDLRGGVLSALELWRENVLQALVENFGIEPDWQAVSIDAGSPLIDKLVAAAASK